VGEGCLKGPVYNFEGKKGLYCNDHKLPEMINVSSKRCLEKSCKKQALFNFENEKLAIYCGEHLLLNMINIKRPKCVKTDCNISALFNYDDEKDLFIANRIVYRI